MTTPDDVLQFWFGTGTHPWNADPGKAGQWFRGGPEVDEAITRRFGATLVQAASGELAHWAETVRGRLALVLVLDQFSRNVFRGKPQAFAQDALARALVLQALDAGEDQQLRPIERMFLYLPLEHAEDPALQARSVALFTALAAQAPADQQVLARSLVSYAEQHRDVIARFGRFPHRNQALGRPSTPEEAAYVAEGEGF